ncbi:MAG TPA: hypothetical protein VHM30_03540, partial [Gemmatimonadaceae bacterium]|nr:hypothetical protein [Gemmatimonadaceae bacterium]
SVIAAFAGAADGGTRSHDGILLYVLALWLCLPLALLFAVAALWIPRARSAVARISARALPLVGLGLYMLILFAGD